MSDQTNWFLLSAGSTVNLISFGSGIGFSWSSPVLPRLHLNNTNENPLGRPITAFEESWIGSLICLGGVCGPFISNLLINRIGYKTSLLYLAILMICSYLTLAFATIIELYYIARLLIGSCSGCIYAIVPMYLGEIAEDKNRGSLGVLFGFFGAIGTLFSFVIGPYTSIQTLSLLCTIPFLLFMVIFGAFIPESPYFYIIKNNYKQAEISLKKLRNCNHNIQKELDSMIVTVENNNEKLQFKDLCKSNGLRRGLFISISLVFFQQMSGINVFNGYLQSIFSATGSDLAPEISSMIVGSIQVFVSLIISQLIDRLGRRLLLIISMIGTVLSTGFLGLYFYLKVNCNYNLDIVSWLPILCLICYMISFAVGIGPVAWTMVGELFPTNSRTIAATLTSSSTFILAFVTTVFFPNFIESFDMGLSCWLFTIVSLIGLIFVIVFVPETKGRSFQQIQDLLSNGKNC